MSILPVTYSAANPEALLNTVIPQFNIEKAIGCEFWCQGLNDTYKVRTESDIYILRIYRYQWRSYEEISFEIDALLHLHNNGADVATPIQTYDGTYIISLALPEGRRYAILTQYITGEELDFSLPENTTLFAQHVAKLHQASKEFNSPHPRFELDVKHLITQPLIRIQPFLQSDDWLFLQDYANNLTNKLQNALDAPQSIILCHGDLHGGNTHRNDEQLASFDFDCCGFGLRCYDLAVFKWSLAVNKKEPKLWQQFIETYQQKYPLNPDEIELIDSLVAIRHIWLIGLHIDIAIAKGWLNEQYFNQKISFLRKQQTMSN